ncbi:MAG: UDP-N-acetylglucosamine 2-epimerase [Tepidisphaeraceae bacterium]|jgi:UDP-hydrolysing UDP-N-acetyl-D-glucosamine 2-epimerase
MPSRPRSLTVCFVTGTRAEFGLMKPVLQAIQRRRGLRLRIVATGMHLDRRHGYTFQDIGNEGFVVDATVPWSRTGDVAKAAGLAIAGLAAAYAKLKPDVVLVAGDRVEPFAGAVAAHLSHRLVAHVHGGDRAAGQVDDSLRHAITKLSHVHLAATAASARRILRLGEDRAWVFNVGSPGNDGIVEQAAATAEVARRYPGLKPGRYALLLLHPALPDDEVERRRAELVLSACRGTGFERIVVVYPNNDPGARGIMAAWEQHRRDADLVIEKSLPRGVFLGLMRDAAVLVGNSSSGIIEAASFGTPVVDVGPRQLGRECSRNVVHCPYDSAGIAGVLGRIWSSGRCRRSRCRNVYGQGGAGVRMADILASLAGRRPTWLKLIRY